MLRAKAAAVILALAMAASLCGCAETEKSTAMLTNEAGAAKTANYRTATAELGDLIKTSELSLEPIYYLSQTLYSPADGLFFDSFAVKRGDTLKEGQLIATFTKKGSEAELEGCKLALQRAQEEYESQSAKLQYDVDSASGLQKELNQLELDRYQYNQLLELDRLQKQVDEAESAFDDEYLYAPCDCVIYSLANLDSGASAEKGTEIAQIKQADSLVLFSTTTAKNFLYNMNVNIEYGRKDSRVPTTGRVVSNDAVLPDGVMGDGYLYIRLDESISEDELNKPSASVTTVQAKNALLVPRGAVEVEDGHYYVSILDGGMVKKRYIIRGITGGTVGESCTVVLAGVQPGQTVVLD